MAALYFIPLFLMDNYILVNLFVAIICWGWEQADNTEQVIGFTLTCHGDAAADFPPAVQQMLKTALSRTAHCSHNAIKLKAEPFLASTFHVNVRIVPSNPSQVEQLLHCLPKEAVVEAVGSVGGLNGAELAAEAEVMDAEDEEEEMAVEKARILRAHEQLAFNVPPPPPPPPAGQPPVTAMPSSDTADAASTTPPPPTPPPPPEGSLRAEHQALKAYLAELAASGRLGLTPSDVTALETAFDAPLDEFVAAASSALPPPEEPGGVVPPRAPLATTEAVAGLAAAFGTLVSGMRQLVAQMVEDAARLAAAEQTNAPPAPAPAPVPEVTPPPKKGAGGRGGKGGKGPAGAKTNGAKASPPPSPPPSPPASAETANGADANAVALTSALAGTPPAGAPSASAGVPSGELPSEPPAIPPPPPAPEPPTPEPPATSLLSDGTALLLAYWDSAHAQGKRLPSEALRVIVPPPPPVATPPPRKKSPPKGGSGGKGGGGAKGGSGGSQRNLKKPAAPPPPPPAPAPAPLALRISGSQLVDQLELLMKQYVTALPALGEANATFGAKLQEAREVGRSALHAMPSSAHPKSLLTAPAHDEPTGAGFVPLGNPAAAARGRQLRELVMAPAFEGFIQLCILCSSAALAFDMPDVAPGSQLERTLHTADVAFTSIFVVEMSLKLMVFGAFAPPDGYFRSAWNQLDATIVATSVLSLILTSVEGLGALRAMRALRALRPLRTIQRFPGLKKLVNSLLRSVPGVGDVSQVCMLFLVVYGLFAMFLLMGRMAECNDPSIQLMEQCVGTFVDTESGVTLPRWWGNDDIGNFDHIGAAMLTLFEMATLEMWPDVMFRAMDTDPHAEGRGLVRNANASTMAPFMISWIVVSAFLLINLFVGVVLENFNAIRKKEDGSGFMDEGQKQWAKTMQAVFSSKAQRKNLAPEGKGSLTRLRHRCFRLVSGEPASAIAFEKGVALLVFVNVITMAFKWYDQPEWVDIFSEVVDWFFTIAFTLEMSIKLLGLGWTQYLADGWNCLDGTLVTFSIIDHGLQYFAETGLPVSPTFMRMMRFFRIARLLKLIRVNPGIKRLLATVVVSAPSLANVGVLLLLILYIYAILGVEFFSGVAHGEFLNEDANFSSFGFAMLTLFRCITGESYNGIMHDASVTEAGSAPGRCYDSDGNCGSPALAIPFFLSFTVIGSFVMLNVFVAVILDAFAEDAAAETVTFGPIQIDEFSEVWTKFEAGNAEVSAGTPRGISTLELSTDQVLPILILPLPQITLKPYRPP